MKKLLTSLALLCAVSAFAQAADTYIATINDPVTFTATADGTQPFTYVWKKDGVVIANQVAVTYRIASAKPADAGVYSVVITNSAGSATGAAVFTVTIIPPGNPHVIGSKL